MTRADYNIYFSALHLMICGGLTFYKDFGALLLSNIAKQQSCAIFVE
jgi:hypothetical protein